jgi:magnesium transporter
MRWWKLPGTGDVCSESDRGEISPRTRLINGSPVLPQRSKTSAHEYRAKPGDLPGIEHVAAASVPPEPDSVAISYIDYSATRIEIGDITDVDKFLDKPLPDWVEVRWINVSNIHPYIIDQFRHHFDFHTLTAEDVLHITQRPRVEILDDHFFVVMRILQMERHESESKTSEWALDTEQLSFFSL